MLLSSFSSEAIFFKSEGLDITERLEEKEIVSVAEESKSDKATLLEKKSLEENELGWAVDVTEFEKEIFSWASEVSQKELALFLEKELTFLSLDVTQDVEGKDKLIVLLLQFVFWQGWNCSLDCFESTLDTKEFILGNSNLIFFVEDLELVFTLLLLYCNNDKMIFLKFLKLYKITQWFTSTEQQVENFLLWILDAWKNNLIKKKSIHGLTNVKIVGNYFSLYCWGEP